MSQQCFASTELNIIRFQISTGTDQTHSSNVIMTGPLLWPVVLSARFLTMLPMVTAHLDISCGKLNAAEQDQCYQCSSADGNINLSACQTVWSGLKYHYNY